MKQRATIPDDEIQRLMDFDGLLKKRQLQAVVDRMKLYKLMILPAALITAITILYFQRAGQPPIQKSQTEKGTIQLKNDQPSSTRNNISQDSASKINKNKTTSPKTLVKQESPGKKKLPPQSQPEVEKDVYQEAEPVEGFANLYNYFNSNLEYPKANLTDSIEGIEIISFVVNESGSVRDLKVVQSLGPLFDTEAFRLVNNMPKWKPAMHNREAVPSKISVPITFNINHAKK